MKKKKSLSRNHDRVIGVVGLWHLGSVLSAVWSRLGKTVIGFDTLADRVEGLNRGQAPLFEPGLDQAIANGLQNGRLTFSSSSSVLQQADVIILAEDTPVLDNDRSDFSRLEALFQAILPNMKRGAMLMVSSQAPVGTCVKWRERLLKRNMDLELVYSPENLRLGEALNCYEHPGHIVIGGETPEAIHRAFSLFDPMKANMVTMGLSESEMVKHAINAFLATQITFANQFADLCGLVGADFQRVVRAMKADPRIGSRAYLSPGLGFSGGTLGRDLRILGDLDARTGKKSPLFDGIYKYNRSRPLLVVEKLSGLLKGLKGKKIGVLGVTYKPGTSTLRRSLQFEVVNAMLARGAKVSAFDPKANWSEVRVPPALKVAAGWSEAVQGADAVVLLTEWREFQDIDFRAMAKLMKGRLLIDTKNLWLGRRPEEFKPLTYLRIG